MLPNATPPTWPDLAFWRDTAQRLEAQVHTLHATLEAERRLNDALRTALDAQSAHIINLYRKLDRLLDRAPSTDSMRAAMAKPQSCTCYPDEAPVPCQRKYAFSECKAAAMAKPFPARALQVWR